MAEHMRFIIIMAEKALFFVPACDLLRRVHVV